jgi:hypothetical protein
MNEKDEKDPQIDRAAEAKLEQLLSAVLEDDTSQISVEQPTDITEAQPLRLLRHVQCTKITEQITTPTTQPKKHQYAITKYVIDVVRCFMCNNSVIETRNA